MLSKLGSSIIKLASRWKDFVANLNENDYLRLMDSGCVKPKMNYVLGMINGVKNKADITKFKTDGAEIYSKPSFPESGADYKTRTIRVGYKHLEEIQDPDSREVLRAFIGNHEADEAFAIYKGEQRLKNNPDKYTAMILDNCEKVYPGSRRRENDETILRKLPIIKKLLFTSKNPGILVSERSRGLKGETGHMDMDVYLNERKLVDRFPYRNDEAILYIKDKRAESGETQFYDKAGKYNHGLERFNKQNINKAKKNAKQPQVIDGFKFQTLKTVY